MKTYVDAAKLQEYTTKLVAKLKTIFTGTPQPAPTVADMTDHDKLYVYTGSETGYTAGNLYFWNGTAWTAGGVYNSAVIETDTTLSVSGKAADGKATGDAIAAAKAAVLAEIAPAYSTSGTYAVGDYVIYNSGLYRCISAISTAESWTAAHWVSVDLAPDLGGQVAALKTQLRNGFELAGNGNTYVGPQTYFALNPGSWYRVWINKWDKTGITESSSATLAQLGYTNNGSNVFTYTIYTNSDLDKYYDIYVKPDAVNPSFVMGGRIATGTKAVVTVENLDTSYVVENTQLSLSNIIKTCSLVGNNTTGVSVVSEIQLIPGHYYRVYINKWDITGLSIGSGVDIASFGYTDNGTNVSPIHVRAPQSLDKYYDLCVAPTAINPVFIMGGRAVLRTTALVSIVDLNYIDDDKAFELYTKLVGNASFNGIDATFVSDIVLFDLEPGKSYRVYIQNWDITNVPTSGVTLAQFGYTDGDTTEHPVIVYSNVVLKNYYDFEVPNTAINPKFTIAGRAKFDTRATVSVFDISEDLYIKNKADNLGNIGRNKFNVAANGTHSSTIDRIKIDIAENTPFLIGIDVTKTVPSSLAMFYAIKSDGTSVNILNVYPNVTNEKIFRLVLDYAIKYVGVYYKNDVAEQVTVHFYASSEMIDENVLYNKVNDVTLAEELYSDLTKNILAKYANTEKSDVFTFYSDPHYLLTNGEMTLKRINAILNEWIEKVDIKSSAIGANLVICGGDIINAEPTDADLCYKLAMHKAIVEKRFGDKYKFVLGNHDSRFDATDQDVLDNMLFAETDTGKAYYSAKTANTRFYILNTGTDQLLTMSEYRWAQIAWLADKFLTNDDANSIIAMHIFSTGVTEENFANGITPMAENVILLVEAYNSKSTVTLNGITYDFTQKTGKMRCILAGHLHYDKVYYTANNTPVLCIDDADDLGASAAMRMDSCFADYTNGKLYAYRTATDVREVNLA